MRRLALLIKPAPAGLVVLGAQMQHGPIPLSQNDAGPAGERAQRASELLDKLRGMLPVAAGGPVLQALASGKPGWGKSA